MNEHKFLLLLQERAKEQERAMKAAPFPKVFLFISTWLSHHPWRYLIPLAFVVSLILRGIFGPAYTDFVLWIFRSIL